MKSFKNTISFGVVGLLVLISGLIMPMSARANHQINRSDITVVNKTDQELIDDGCVRPALAPGGGPGGSGRYIIPHDKPFVYFGSDTTIFGQPVACAADLSSQEILGVVGRNFLYAIAYMLTIVATLAAILIQLVSSAVAAVLTVSVTNHPFVLTGFPFVLGFLNLIFIIALLVLAVMVVLRSESVNARRTLPRIILAALLVNFSLVFAGIILDVSRLFMAVMANLIGSLNDLDNIGLDLLRNSAAFNKGLNIATTTTPEGGTSLPAVHINNDHVSMQTSQMFADVVVGVCVAFMFLVGMTVFAVVLFVRLVILILLLVFAATPYALRIFPATESLARGWWEKYLKYVFLGPIMFFLLILLTRIPSVTIVGAGGIVGGVIKIALAAAILGAGAVAGIKVSSFMGAATAAGYAGGATKLLRRAGIGSAQFANKHPVAAGILGGVATGGVGFAAGLGAAKLGKAGVDATRNRLGDFSREATRPFRAKWRLGEYSKRNKDGTLKDGEKTLGSITGKGVGRFLTPLRGMQEPPEWKAERIANQEGEETSAAYKGVISGKTDKGMQNVKLTPNRLRNEVFISSIEKDASGRSMHGKGIAGIISFPDTKNTDTGEITKGTTARQAKALVSGPGFKELLRGKSDTERTEIIETVETAIEENDKFEEKEKADITNELQKMYDQLRKEEKEGRKPKA